jgi:hypothetical protein
MNRSARCAAATPATAETPLNGGDFENGTGLGKE